MDFTRAAADQPTGISLRCLRYHRRTARSFFQPGGGHGGGKGAHGGGPCHHPEHGPHHEPCHEPEPCPHKDELCYEGKICSLHFNHFGDFTGFWLEIEKGKHKFRSREKEVEPLAREAWAQRIPVLVIVDQGDCTEPISIVYLHPPAGL